MVVGNWRVRGVTILYHQNAYESEHGYLTFHSVASRGVVGVGGGRGQRVHPPTVSVPIIDFDITETTI